MVICILKSVTEFKAERKFTKNNVAFTIDAILRCKIIDEKPNDTNLNVEDLNDLIQQVSQTTLCNSNGSFLIQEIMPMREEINESIGLTKCIPRKSKWENF